MEEIKIFLSCPDDIVKNGIKDIIEGVIEEDNIYFKKIFGVSFDLKHWKENVYLGKGNPRVQDRINEILCYCDIYLGILWIRFGSPPSPNLEEISYSSGTEEEFYFAESLNKKLWFLFCYYPIDPCRIDTEQLDKVRKFKEKLKKEKIWYGEFSKEEELRKLLKKNMSNFIKDFIKEKYSISISEEKERNLQSLPNKEDFLKYSRGF